MVVTKEVEMTRKADYKVMRCPFCGSGNIRGERQKYKDTLLYGLRCCNCSTRTGRIHTSFRDAVRHWNTRSNKHSYRTRIYLNYDNTFGREKIKNG